MHTNSATVHNIRQTSSVYQSNDKVEFQHIIQNAF